MIGSLLCGEASHFGEPHGAEGWKAGESGFVGLCSGLAQAVEVQTGAPQAFEQLQGPCSLLLSAQLGSS